MGYGTTFMLIVDDKTFIPTRDQIAGIFQILKNHDVVPASADSEIKSALEHYPRAKSYEDDTKLLELSYPVKKQFITNWLGKDYECLMRRWTEYSKKVPEEEISVGMVVHSIPFHDPMTGIEAPSRFVVFALYLGQNSFWDDDLDEDDESAGNDEEEEDSDDDFELSGDKQDRLFDEFFKLHATLLADLDKYLKRPLILWTDMS